MFAALKLLYYLFIFLLFCFYFLFPVFWFGNALESGLKSFFPGTFFCSVFNSVSFPDFTLFYFMAALELFYVSFRWAFSFLFLLFVSCILVE